MFRKNHEIKYVESSDINNPKETIILYGVSHSKIEEYVKAGIGLYIGYTLASKIVPMIKNKIKKN